MESTPKRGRGRPKKPDKLSNADYMRAYHAAKLDRFTVDTPRGTRDRWKAAAAAAGARSLSAWIIDTLNAAADKISTSTRTE